jgi:hypothetical protein
LALLRADGWTAEVVERWVPGVNVRRDLFGFVDVLALRGPDTLAVQVTTATNVSAHIHKIEDAPTLAAVRAAGWSIEVHGWRKSGNRWVVRREDIS